MNADREPRTLFTRLIILGNSGFAGSHVQHHFSTKYPNIEIKGYSSRDIDLADERQAEQLARDFDQKTAVIMCSGIKSNYGSDLSTYARNVAMAQNVCRALSRSPVCRFIFFSSIAVYGVDRHDVDISELTPIAPDTHYGLSKYDSELLLTLELKKASSSPLLILRLPTMYGPHEKLIAATPSGFLTTYLSGREVTLFGDGSELREFIYIDDVSEILDGLLNQNFTGVLNVGTGNPVSYRDALEAISRILNRKLHINHRERTKAKVDKVYNVSVLKSLMPGFQFTTLESGLRKILGAGSPAGGCLNSTLKENDGSNI
jgi:UDP-glucose 4-epimerase